MVKGALFSIVFIFLSIGAFAQAPPWLWAVSGKDEGASISGDVAVDDNGNIYLSGEFTRALTFENQTLVSAGGKDVYVAKFTSQGKLVWAKSAGGIYDDKTPGIAFDNAGYMYLAGSFADQAQFDHHMVTSQGQHDIFLAKYDPDGNLIWVKSFGGLGTETIGASSGRGLFVDANNRIYLTGSFVGTVDFGGTTLTSKREEEDVYFAKLDSAGAVIWAKSAGSNSSDFGIDICVDQAGNVFITGVHDGTIYFDTIKLTERQFGDMFLAKFDSLGNACWAKTAGGSIEDYGGALICDENFNVYVLGGFNSSPIFFGAHRLYNRGSFDVFLAKYNSVGDLVWVKTAGWLGTDTGGDMAYWDKEIYITGHFNQRMIFDNDVLWSHEGKGGEDGFVAKYNVDGEFQWAKNAGGLGGDRLFGIAIDPIGYPVVAGRINSTSAPLGSATVFGPNAPFIAKIGLFPESVAEIESEEFFIYPNPATKTIQIQNSHGIQIAKGFIQDIQGRVMKHYSSLGTPLFDVSDLPEGMYLLFIETDRGRVVQKFLKVQP